MKIRVPDDGGGDENKEIVLIQRFGFASEGISENGDIAQNGDLCIRSCRIVPDQATHDERVGVGNKDLSLNAAIVKHGG